MPNCTYCGKPAGLFRRSHADCAAQFDRATSTIPLFFEKLLDSDLPTDRFKQLLKEVAEQFHIGPKKLRTLSVQGVNAMVQASLAQRLMTPDEEDRILEIAEALGLSISEIPDLEEKLAKIAVLRDLADGRIPDRIDVVGPMPIDLEANETIIWIINGARFYGLRDGPVKSQAPSQAQHDMPAYFSPASLGQQPVPTHGLIEKDESDVMITDRRLFVVSKNRNIEIRLPKVESFHAYANGFQIVRAAKKGRPLVVTVADPWFAANLIVKLVRLSTSSGPQLEGAWKTS